MRLDINLNLYRTFYVVGKSETLTKAAQKLHITQSSVSQQIKDLEDILNVQLFHRNPKGIELTNTGKLFLEYIENGLSTLNLGEKMLIDSQDLDNVSISIGVQSHIASFYLLDIISKFQKDFPNAHINLISGSSNQLINGLLNYEIDFVIDNSPIEINNVKMCIKKLSDYKTCFVVNSSEYDEDKKLSDYKFILPNKRSSMRKSLNDILAHLNITLKDILEVETTDVIVKSVKKGLGAGYVIKKAVEEELNSEIFKEIPVDFDLPNFELNLIYLNDGLTNPVKQFIENYLK